VLAYRVGELTIPVALPHLERLPAKWLPVLSRGMRSPQRLSIVARMPSDRPRDEGQRRQTRLPYRSPTL